MSNIFATQSQKSKLLATVHVPYFHHWFYYFYSHYAPKTTSFWLEKNSSTVLVFSIFHWIWLNDSADRNDFLGSIKYHFIKFMLFPNLRSFGLFSFVVSEDFYQNQRMKR